MDNSTSKNAMREGVKRSSIGDMPTENDDLGFEPYVTGIVEFLLDDETEGPLTLSIEGEWGSGKSSFMLQLSKALELRNAWTVWFNAWRHDKEDALWASFALHFIRSLSRKRKFLSRQIARMTLWWRRYDWEEGWPSTLLFLLACGLLAVPIAIIISTGTWQRLINVLGDNKVEFRHVLLTSGGVAYPLAAIYIIKKLKALLINPFSINLKQFVSGPEYKQHSAFIEDFHHDFTHIVETYAGVRKIFVFIDDLDRCDTYKGADLVQGINLMISGTSKIFFIIGMDREKVAAGLAVKYEKLLPYIRVSVPVTEVTDYANFAKGLEFGYNFIEKFIQIPFAVPQPLVNNIMKFIDATIADETSGANKQATSKPKVEIDIGKDSKKIKDIILMVAPTLDNNPRRIKQFINLFRIRAYIGSQTGLFIEPDNDSGLSSITLEKLGKFVALIIQWPRIVVEITYNPVIMSNLQRIAWKGYLADPESDYWAHKKKLLELLRAGFTNIPGVEPSPEEKEKYSLDNIDISKLTSISPRLERLGKITDSNIANESSKEEAEDGDKFAESPHGTPKENVSTKVLNMKKSRPGAPKIS